MRHPIVIYCLLPLLLVVSGLSTARAASAQTGRLTGSQMRQRSSVAAYLWCRHEEIQLANGAVVFKCIDHHVMRCHHGEHLSEGFCRISDTWLWIQNNQVTTCERRVRVWLTYDKKHHALIHYELRPYNAKKDCTHTVSA